MTVAEPRPVAVRTRGDRPIVPRLQRRVLTVLVLTQLFGGAGVTTGVAVSALLAAHLSGSEVVGGLALTCSVLGAAVAAPLIARIADRAGRRPALSSATPRAHVARWAPPWRSSPAAGRCCWPP